ncbi:recombinase family protein [Marinisporobacter balticus]|uniref:Site-specific DNA recombinase n=1 Tax=Marinisporobacter balticus TaxID=2018667 RepID=A0A4R2KQ08_9FIRM|nr:recombinase family protein [Marinisporobacter balticus]TCO72188.1 site-specific DNA recombinase [Marinisporobacter balticus]
MKKASIYIRVSTQEQAKEGYSIAAQQDKLIAYCKAKNWSIYDIYIDDGYTGTNLDRPGINQLLDHLNDIDIVLVYKLDRLSRSQRDVLYLVEEKLLNSNVDFVSLLESFDTSTPFGRAMLGILAVFAQLERETIIERSKLGKERRAKEGLWRGGGNIPIGYDFVNDELIINPYETMQIQEIFHLYTQGYGQDKIAALLNEKGLKTNSGAKWTGSQIRRALNLKTYAGYIEYNGEYYPGNHKAIISAELFDTIAKLLHEKKSSKHPTVQKSKYLLGGMLWCGYCGARLKANWSSKGKGGPKYYFYICYSKAKRPLHMVKDPNCPSKYWKMNKLDAMVIKQLLELPLNKDKIIATYEENKEAITFHEDKIVLEQQISEVDKQIDRLMDLYQNGKIPAQKISDRIDSLYQDRKKLEKTISALEKEMSEEEQLHVSLDEVLSMLGNFEPIWNEATFEEKRIILKDFIKKIVVTDRVEIVWNYKNL